VTATATRSGSPSDRGRFDPRLKLVVFSLIGIALYYLVLSVMVTGGGPVAAQQVANALTLGAIYALVALGYTMVYGIIELINFAHGDVFMVGTFMSLFFLSSFPEPLDFLGLHLKGPIEEPLVLALVMIAAFLFGMTVMGLINVTIERFAYRPLRHAPRVAPLITAIGVSLILQNVMQIIVGTGDRLVPQLFPPNKVQILGANVGVLNIFIVSVALILMYVLQLFVGRTRLGRAMRATAQDQQAAQLMGVDLNQTIAMTFLIGGALAGAAGVFQGQYFGFVRFDLGFNAGLKAFTAAVLGGIGNLAGAVLGGFLIAFVEVFAAANGQQRWSQAIVFVVLILVLVFRPAGILGQQIGERA
jgi:branched-chain amino acid transport system permease protein